jgi:hypothetical protein
MAMVDIELAHEVEETPHHRRLAALVGVAAILAAALGALQMHDGSQEGRASARASRLSAEIARGLAIDGLVSAFHLPTAQTVIAVGLEATSRALAAFEAEEGVPVATAAADADTAAVERLTAILDAMVATPGPESGVDPATLETLARDLEALSAMTIEQNAAVDRAERYSKRGDRAVLALSIAAVAAVLLGLAGIVGAGRAGTGVLWAAGVALVVAAVLGGSSLLIN